MYKNKDSFWSLLKSDMVCWLFIILILFFKLFYNYYLICCPMSKYNYPDCIYIPQSIHLKSLFPKGYITSSCQSLEQNVRSLVLQLGHTLFFIAD